MEDFQGLLNIATDVGFCLLENGAEIYRVEDSGLCGLTAFQK